MEKDSISGDCQENKFNHDRSETGSTAKDENNVNTDLTKECEEAGAEEVEEILSEEVKIQKQNEALDFKEQGNKNFKEQNYEAAADLYTKGIKTCPKCYSKTMSVLLANRAACSAKLDMTEPAIKDCTSALEYDSYYTKARLRRAQLYEKGEQLEQALKDYNEILNYDKSCTVAGEAAMRLPHEINERNEKVKEEMFSKLKELGNTCLKPFGLSTENFKVNQDPDTGGYSINFQK